MKIVFMGTPEFSLACFERLLAEGHEVLAAFVQPDKPKGRKMHLVAPPVKVRSIEAGIPVEQPTTLRYNEALETLREYAPELIIVVAYGKILPSEILALPKYGCVNVHASLLPKYRGAAPYQWAVLNGETESGVTTMLMAEGIDTGDMLLQRRCAIPEDMTAGELHDVLAKLGADTLAETLCLMETGRLVPQPQDSTQATHAPMLGKALSPIDWQKSAAALHNQVRGLNPWPGAETVLLGRRLKIHRSRVAMDASSGMPPGTISVDAGHVLVSCGDGALELLEVQPEGKRAMNAMEYLRGVHCEDTLRFE